MARLLSTLFLITFLTSAVAQDQELIDHVKGLDRDPKCCYWASKGYCDGNAAYMRVNCQRSCGTIGCTGSTYETCEVTVSAICGGAWDPNDIHANKPFKARDVWNVHENIKTALSNPIARPLLQEAAIKRSKRAKRQTNMVDRQQHIHNSFPDGQVMVLEDELPLNIRVGAILYESFSGEQNSCFGTIVNLGSADLQVMVVLTSAQCVVEFEPESGDCEEYKDLECRPKSELVQFRLNHRTNDEDGILEYKDILNWYFPKGVCYLLCQGDHSKDYAFLEIAAPHFTHTHSFRLSTEISEWAVSFDYPLKDCSAGYDTNNLPSGLSGDASTCWGNDQLRHPLGFGGPVEAGVQVNGQTFNFQADEPFSGVGGGWLSDNGQIVGVSSFGIDGVEGVYSPVFDSSDFLALRNHVIDHVEAVDMNNIIGAFIEPWDTDAVDIVPMCCAWAKSEKCNTNPFWMRVNCQKSCGTPGCTVPFAMTCTVRVPDKC